MMKNLALIAALLSAASSPVAAQSIRCRIAILAYIVLALGNLAQT